MTYDDGYYEALEVILQCILGGMSSNDIRKHIEEELESKKETYED